MPADAQHLDSNVLLAYVRNESDRASVVGQLLQEARDGKRRLIASTEAIVEVTHGAGKSRQEALDPQVLERIDALWVSGGGPVELVDPSIRIMFRARDYVREGLSPGRGIAPKDAIHLATTVQLESPVLLTYECEETRDLWASIAGVRVEEPTIGQPPLF